MKLLYFTICLIYPLQTWAQSSKPFIIETSKAALVLKADSKGVLRQVYLGTNLLNSSEYEALPEEGTIVYPTFGTDYRREPAFRVRHSDGNPSTELRFIDMETKKIDQNISITTFILKDPAYPLVVSLNIKTYAAENIFEQWTEISHSEKKSVVLENFASSCIASHKSEYILTHFNGDWSREVQQQEDVLTPGIKTIDSKLGSRAHLLHSPMFMVSLNGKSTEDTGEVIAGTLAWSGNFRFDFELDEDHRLRILSGMNWFASEYTLKPNEIFKTPAFLFTYSVNGKGEASRNFHRWGRNYGLLKGTTNRFILLNNWEATYFDFNEEKLVSLVEDAANLGVDLFLLDDGWFGNKYPRNADNAGLGDWEVNKKKLPNGLNNLVEVASEKNLKFGIWIEPEMVNPASELYEKHPDWIIKLPNRQEDLQRNQLVLDLSNPKVQEYVFNCLDKLLIDQPNLAYIKWDANRYFSNAYSAFLKPDEQSHIYIEYVKGLYKVMQRFNKKYPNFPMMLCSGGGGRVDYGALPYFTEFWPSDMTDPVKRIYIQWGYSYFFPSVAMCAHVTSMGNASLKFKTDLSMSAKLGFDLVPSALSTKDRAFAKKSITYYREISSVVQQGDLYRLVSPYEDSRAIMMYASEDGSEAVLFGFQTQTKVWKQPEATKLKGLDPAKLYLVKEINLSEGSESRLVEHNMSLSGDYLMNVGLHLPLYYDFTSTIVQIKSKEYSK